MNYSLFLSILSGTSLVAALTNCTTLSFDCLIHSSDAGMVNAFLKRTAWNYQGSNGVDRVLPWTVSRLVMSLNSTQVREMFLRGLHNVSEIIVGISGIEGMAHRTFGTWCEPPEGVRRRQAVQLLVHGLSYNRSVWGGLGYSDTYNWHTAATNAGYYTLAIDLLGHGQQPTLNQSSEYTTRSVDPFHHTQSTIQLEYLHSLISYLRGLLIRETWPVLPAMDQVFWVGHGYGSMLGAHHSASHPGAIDGYVLTGMSSTPNQKHIFTLLKDFYPASDVQPQGLSNRYSNWRGHLTETNESLRTEMFYGGGFDPKLAHLDFSKRDTITMGEVFSNGSRISVSTYPGPVLVATGDRDSLFCASEPSKCQETLDRTKEMFPNASTFESYVIPDTGHTLNLHYTAPNTTAFVNQWLSRNFP